MPFLTEPTPDQYIDWGFHRQTHDWSVRIVQVPGQPWQALVYDRYGRFSYAYHIAVDSFGDFR